MGMFDEIIIPKSYLRGILDKKDESLFNTYHKFQTKDIEPVFGGGLELYKLYRGYLRKQVGNEPGAQSKNIKWEKTNLTKEVSMYDTFTTKDGNECWFEFEFVFVNGKLDSKRLVDKNTVSKADTEAVEVMWDIEQNIFNEYRKKLSYMFWTKVERFCQKLSVMAHKKHSIPYDIRKTAYKTSGRLEKDPKCLDMYVDS